MRSIIPERSLLIRTKMCEIRQGRETQMTREQFIQELRKLARERGSRFEVLKDGGKGSPYKVVFGERATVLKSGEMTPSYVRLVKKQLGIL